MIVIVTNFAKVQGKKIVHPEQSLGLAGVSSRKFSVKFRWCKTMSRIIIKNLPADVRLYDYY